MNSSLDGFDAKSEPEIDVKALQLEVDRFCYNTLPHLSEGQARYVVQKIRELNVLPEQVPEAVAYGADYDIKNEVENLLRAARAMQNSIMDDSGVLKKDSSPREVREVVTSMTSLMQLIMKSHEKLMGFDRQRALEQSTVSVLREMGGQETVDRFVKMMEECLEQDG